MAPFVEDAAKFYDKNYHDLIIIHVCDKLGLHPGRMDARLTDRGMTEKKTE